MNIINGDWIIISLCTVRSERDEKTDSVDGDCVLGVGEILLKSDIIGNFIS